MKRVFQSVRFLNLAGTEMVVMNWYRHVNRQKIQFDFGVDKKYSTPFVEEIKQKGGRIFIIPNSKGVIGTVKYLFALYKTLKTNGPYEAFHSHEQWMGGLTCLVAKWAGIPKRFLISHSSDRHRSVSLKKKIFRPIARLFISQFCTCRLAVSEEAGKSLYGKYLNFDLLHNGIELQKFMYNPKIRAQKRIELSLQDKFVIGHVGRLSEEKNHGFLLEIFTEIYKLNPQARLVLVGDGKLKSQIKQQIKELEIENVVFVVGTVSDVNAFYQAFDVFLFPSLYEGLPVSLVEAQCAGLPCFISENIPKEAFLCNAYLLSLKNHPKLCAQEILAVIGKFVRKDESDMIRKAGFDIQDTSKEIQQMYLA